MAASGGEPAAGDGAAGFSIRPGPRSWRLTDAWRASTDIFPRLLLPDDDEHGVACRNLAMLARAFESRTSTAHCCDAEARQSICTPWR